MAARRSFLACLHGLQRLGSFFNPLSWKKTCSPAVQMKSSPQSTHLIERSSNSVSEWLHFPFELSLTWVCGMTCKPPMRVFSIERELWNWAPFERPAWKIQTSEETANVDKRRKLLMTVVPSSWALWLAALCRVSNRWANLLAFRMTASNPTRLWSAGRPIWQTPYCLCEFQPRSNLCSDDCLSVGLSQSLAAT